MSLCKKAVIILLFIFINVCLAPFNEVKSAIIDLEIYRFKDLKIQQSTDSTNQQVNNLSIQYLDSLNKLWCVKKRFGDLEIYRFRDSTNQQVNKSTNKQLSDREYSRKFSAIKSEIGLTYNDKVKKFIEIYFFDKKFQTEIMTGLFKNELPLFDKVIGQKHLPSDLKYLPLAESSLYNNAKSGSGATGIWQLSFTSARQYGLIVNSFIDERKDALKSTQAATSYLKDLYKIYNDWLLAIAAYNSSPSIVNKAIRRSKLETRNWKLETGNFWSVYNNLPRDSREYVTAFIATVYVMNYYKDYDFKPVMINFPAEADTVVVLHQLHFKQISAILKLPAAQISEMNPVYKENIIPANTDGNVLALPCGYGEKFYALKDSIYKYKDSTIIAYLKLYQSYNNVSNDDNIRTITDIYYFVKSNDNLNKIAKAYGVTVSDLKKWNHLKGKSLKRGQKLKIHFIVHSNQSSVISRQSSVLKPDSSIKADTANGKSIKPQTNQTYTEGEYIVYKVKSGDSFWKIAKSNGVTIKDILALNDFDEDAVIKPGQVIKIKKCEN